MNLKPFDPWQELRRVHQQTREIWDRYLEQLEMLGSMDAGPVAFVPEVDLVETRSDFRIFVAAPGFVEEDFEIVIEPHSLMVRGERYPPYDCQRFDAAACEWRYGYFERVVRFPRLINVENVTVNYDSGVLTIVAEKSEKSAARSRPRNANSKNDSR